MSKNFERIKRALSQSTTMPAGTGGSHGWLDHGLEHSHHHAHHNDGCCDHSHGEDHTEKNSHSPSEQAEVKVQSPGEQDDEFDCDEDHTNPRGGCGCC